MTATIYCPFSGDAGTGGYCTPNPSNLGLAQHCCETPAGAAVPSECVTKITNPCPSIPGTIDWQCNDPVTDCPSGDVCCALGANIGLGGVMGAEACQNFAHQMTGTTCVPASACPNTAASAGANPPNILVCTSNPECPNGQQCLPFTKTGSQVGGCCVTTGHNCLAAGDCCSGVCTGGTCACVPAGGACIAAGDCCSNTCSGTHLCM
jgi:hypothetical protein